jgi:thioredoxin-related protein
MGGLMFRHTKFIVILFLLFSVTLFADYKTGKEIFKHKCSSCHAARISGEILKKNFYEKNNTMLNLSAPTVNMLAFFLTRAPEHIGDSSDPQMQKLEVADFMKDYLYKPNRKDSIVEDKFLKFFTTKKSMKGIVSEEEIDNIADYLVDYKKRRVVSVEKSMLKNMSTKELIQKAKKDNKIILVEAISKTCYYCKRMEKEVLSLPDVKNAIYKNFIYIKVDIDKTKLPLGLDKRYKHMTPTFFTLSPNGKFKHMYPGAWNKDDFLLILKENL